MRCFCLDISSIKFKRLNSLKIRFLRDRKIRHFIFGIALLLKVYHYGIYFPTYWAHLLSLKMSTKFPKWRTHFESNNTCKQQSSFLFQVLSIVNFIHINLGCSVLAQIKPFVYLLNFFYVFIFMKKANIFFILILLFLTVFFFLKI